MATPNDKKKIIEEVVLFICFCLGKECSFAESNPGWSWPIHGNFCDQPWSKIDVISFKCIFPVSSSPSNDDGSTYMKRTYLIILSQLSPSDIKWVQWTPYDKGSSKKVFRKRELLELGLNARNPAFLGALACETLLFGWPYITDA